MNPVLNAARFFLAGVAFLLSTAVLPAKDDPGAEGSAELEEVQNLNLGFLRSVTCVTVSHDGKFVYATAFASDVVSVFKRDAETGKLELAQRSQFPELKAPVSVRLSPDDAYAAVCAFRANTVSLFRRDATTGELSLLDAAHEGENGSAGLNFVIDATFSADRRYLYSGAAGGIGVFKVADDKLSFVQFETADEQLNGLRAVVVRPDGATLYAAAYISGTVGVLHRDQESGKLGVLQILTDGQDGVESIAGAFRIAVSADGRHVYVSSGRFRGDQAVSVFETQPDGKLKLVEAHVNGEGGFTGFEGGNSIAISPDEKLVYAVASLSDRLVRFRRQPTTGKLTFLGSQVVGENKTPGAAGLCFSPDGKFVYVADESANSIVVFKQP